MRKNKGLFFVVATLLAVTCLLVSCNSEVSENATGGGDKLVYATFGKGNTKALTGTTISTSYKLEEIGDVYWFYKASKADEGGTSGAQSSWYPVIPGQKGLDGVIGPFSTGLWNFEVIAYKDCSTTAPTSPATSDASVTVEETTYYMNTAVFAGSVNGVSLATGTQANPDPINVTVTLSTSGSSGTLTLDRDFAFEWYSGGGTTDLTLKAVYGTGASDSKTVTLKWDTTNGKYVIDNESLTQWEFDAGDYEFDFEVYYTYDNVKYTVATVSDVALKVYGGQETIIKASILEGNFVYAKINATVKSTAVANTVTENTSTTFITSYTPASIKSGSVSQTEVTSIKFEAGSLAATGTKTEIDNSVNFLRIDSYKTEVSVSDIDAAQAQAANFTVAADATPVAAIDASLFVTTTVVNSDNVAQEEAQTRKVETSEFDQSVKVLTTYISKNLTDVAVYYNGSSAVQYAQGQTTGDGFDYEPSTGKLTVYTTHFSEFYVSSKSVAYIPETDTAYDTVKAAALAVTSNQTIQILRDCDISDAPVINKNGVLLDLSGKTLTIKGSKYIDIFSAATIKNGTIIAHEFVGARPAIYVNPGANLVVEDVYISSEYTKDNEVKSAYAIASDGDGTENQPIRLTINSGIFDGHIGTNGGHRYFNFIINDGTFNEGVYFPGYGEYVINDGVFNDFVEIKSGLLTINGGSFNYYFEDEEYIPYENGRAVHGCTVGAVAYNGEIDGTSYGPSPSVVINGGTFAGTIGLARKSFMFSYPSITVASNVTVRTEYLGEDAFNGTGTEEDPYIIDSDDAWMKLVNMCKNDSTYSLTSGKFFSITTDIDGSVYNTDACVQYFGGHINFNEKHFYGFNNTSGASGSLFVHVGGEDALIKNITLTTSTITTGASVIAFNLTEELYGNVTIKNSIIDGSATGINDNNNGLLTYYAGYGNGGYGKTYNYVFENCKNYANISGSSYTAAFIGACGFGNNGNVKFLGCENHGTIISTGQNASMLISNCVYMGWGGNTIITVDDCKNYGYIIGVNPLNTTLFVSPSLGDSVYYTQNATLNNVKLDDGNGSFMSPVNGKTKILDALGDELTGNAPASVQVGSLETSNNKFVLTATENAARYELAFSFASANRNGGGAGYNLKFDTLEGVDINVGSWITKSQATESGIIEHNEYGATYYTCGDSYVYNEEGARFQSPVKAFFIAYDGNGDIISVKLFTYPSN